MSKNSARRKVRADRLERFLVRLIEREGADVGHGWRVRFLLWNLHYLSLVYRSMVQLRLALYERGILRYNTLGCQVISIGNLTVGGTGKTPVVEIFARELAAEGRRVAILSRGYKKVEPALFERLARRAFRTRRECRLPALQVEICLVQHWSPRVQCSHLTPSLRL